jgi:hypothetical protein
MINFLKIQYQMGKITDEQLRRLLELGRINEDDIKVIKGE